MKGIVSPHIVLAAVSLLVSSGLSADIITSTKKGVGSNNAERIDALNTAWSYNWSMNKTAGLDSNIEYVPMRWGKWWPSLTNLANSGEPEFILGFNEPDSANQSDTSVEIAINQWPDIESAAADYDLKTCSPATTNYNDAWMADFMDRADNLDYQVDRLCVHWYKAPNANTLMNQLTSFYNAFGRRPVWLTEFNVADWSGPNDFNQSQSYTFMAEALHRMEASGIIERYAIFPWDGRSSAAQASPIFQRDSNNLTALGKLYAGFEADDVNGPYHNQIYYIHHKSSHRRLTSTNDTMGARNIFYENADSNFKLVPGPNNSWYIENHDSTGRLQFDGSTIKWTDTTQNTGTWVQWRLDNAAHGWKYIRNVGHNKRLNYNGNAFSMVAPTATGNTAQWRFIRPDNDWRVLLSDTFENDFGENWFSAGSDASAYTGEQSPEGDGSILLRDDSSTSIMTSRRIWLKRFSEVNVTFSYRAVSFDNSNEDFFLEMSLDGGSRWRTVASWNLNDEFENNTLMHDGVTIHNTTLSDNTKFRFRADASGNQDYLYIDDIRIGAR